MGITVDILGDVSLAYADFNRFKPEVMAEKINSVIGTVDYRIADLESPFCEKESEVPIPKSGPNLKMQENSILFFEKLHVDGYTLANNHLGDFGEAGIINTIEVLEKLKKDYVGSAKEYAQVYCPLRKTIKGIKISFISVCENEFGAAYDNRIGAAGFDKERMKRILKEENQWADFRLVIFHGGTEYYPYPTPDEKCRYRDLADMGADAVIGMHAHCPKGFENYHGVPIIYSVGNFFFPKSFDTPFEAWKFGYIARLVLQIGSQAKIEIIPYSFDIYGCDFFAVDCSKFHTYIQSLSEEIQNDEHLKELYRAWSLISGKRYFDRMCKSVATEEAEGGICAVKNLFCCEAHNELLKTYLTILYNNDEMKYYSFIEEIKDNMRPMFAITCLENDRISCEDIDVAIWGVGEKAEILFNSLKNKEREKKVIFIDSDILKQGQTFLGRDIISPEAAIKNLRTADFYICTSSSAEKEIRVMLKNNGIKDMQIMRGNV